MLEDKEVVVSCPIVLEDKEVVVSIPIELEEVNVVELDELNDDGSRAVLLDDDPNSVSER